jgi:DNA (cytosine-5)-methyltransferase 1
MKPRLLDAFACQGGATRGYQEAGWHVTAVDLNAGHLARNPAELRVHADAVQFIRDHGRAFDAIHASPPCQRYTRGNAANDTRDYPDLIAGTREACKATGRPYVIENVEDARDELHDPMLLCGTMFGLTALDDDGTVLHLRRHRLFESNVFLMAPPHQHPRGVQWAGAYGGARRDKDEARNVRKGGYVPPAHILPRLLGVTGMSEAGMFECIPPAYAQHIGEQLLTSRERVA